MTPAIRNPINKFQVNARLLRSLHQRLMQAGTWMGTLLPQDCQLCGAQSGATLLCAGCRDALPVLPACCPQCAMPAFSGEICGACLKRPPQFDATLAAMRYEFPADHLVLALKFGARLPIASLLADLMLERIHSVHQSKICKNEMPLPDLLIPMPLHRTRLAERGFNQAVEISRHLANHLHRPLMTGAVWRHRDTLPQSELPLPKRRANVRGAFKSHTDFTGRYIAVVDDVMTSGSTLDELARVLKRAGARRVENWIVARTWTERNIRGALSV